MKISCGIIHDLLPLYIDEVCSEESRAMVEDHIAECERCRAYFNGMLCSEVAATNADKDMKLADGMRKMKNRFDRRMLIGIGCAVAGALAVFAGLVALHNLPLKELGPQDISVDAAVYAVDELPVLEAEAYGTAVSIRKGEDDIGEVLRVQIPAMPDAEICMTENVLSEVRYITVVNWTSDYHLKTMEFGEGEEENTIYVDCIKTSVLNNKARDEMQNQMMLEMRKIDKIVYLNDDGSETVMWEAPLDILGVE